MFIENTKYSEAFLSGEVRTRHVSVFHVMLFLRDVPPRRPQSPLPPSPGTIDVTACTLCVTLLLQLLLSISVLDGHRTCV